MVTKPFKNNFRLTQGWGLNPQIYSKFGLKGHNGIDWGLPNGTEIIAPHAGKVIEKGYDKNGYGNYVKIENDKEGSILAHFQKTFVNVGNTVKQGQLLALSNNTGFSTGPHLHWGYYKKPRNRSNGYSGTMNQLPLLKENNMSNELTECLKQHTKLVDEANEKDKEIKTLKKDFEETNKKIDTLIIGSGLLENKYDTDLAKAKLDYEELLANEKVAFKTELERVEEQHRQDLKDLEQKYKDVSLPEPEKPLLTFKEKLAKALEILFS